MTQKATLSVRDNRDESRFEALDESGVVAGVSAYRLQGDRIVFTHTEVDDAFEGRGVGSTLVRHSLEAARDAGLRVVPRCPFVRSYLEDHPEYADLIGR